MIPRISHFLIATLFPICVFSQRTIKGKVVNASNGQAIQGSSVFISNSSKGTVSDKTGYFELNDVPAGKNDLVVSSIGYETNVFSYSAQDLPLQLRVEMQVKVRELDNVNIEPSLEEGWDRWGKTFMDNFVGLIPNAARCKIKNEKSVRFRYYKKSNRLIAYSDEPLLLENRALGYNLSYQLEDFEIKFREHTVFFAGYPLFEEMNKKKGPKATSIHQREKSYNGSMMNFMRSLYNNTLIADGFEVRRMFRFPNYEKERVKKIYHGRNMANINGGVDSSDYYNRILKQEDHIDKYGKDILTADSLVVKSEDANKLLFFTDYLFITYKKGIEEKEYLQYSREGRAPSFPRSYIFLQTLSPIAIDANGSYYPPQEIYSMGYWSWSEKIASLLPLDYKPPR